MENLKSLLITFISLFFINAFSECTESPNNDIIDNSNKSNPEQAQKENSQIIVAYVQSEYQDIPDKDLMTHINYAFGHVNKTFNGITIDNPSRLSKIAALKGNGTHPKVLLSIGGWASGGFSEMASNESNRKAFALDCKRIIKDYNIDGIDIDWEYPTSSMAGIKSSKDDTKNYTLLMKDIREAIGNDKLLTLASNATAEYIDFQSIQPYVDFVNIMTYDINIPPKLSSPLYSSYNTGSLTCSSSVLKHVNAGIPPEKLVLGIPFYGRTDGEIPDWISYSGIISLIEKGTYKYVWDDEAKEPYLSKNGIIKCSFDDANSISEKCKYVKNKKMKGIMYWQYNGDDNTGTLRQAIYNGIINKK